MSGIQNFKQDNSAPLLSFIITYYNVPINMLQKCVQSILNLSLSSKEREIIVVDDGSDICPINDLLEFRDKIIYIRQCNQGLSAARNTGLRASKGEYIQFVDSDDFLIRPPYEHCLDIVRYNGDIDIVMFESTNNTRTSITFLDSEIETGTEYMHHNNIHATAWGYIFKKKILGDLEFTCGMYHEDEEFTPLLMLNADKVIHSDAKAYFYRSRENSIVHNSSLRNIMKRIDDKEHIIFKLSDYANNIASVDRIALQRRVNQLIMDYIYDVITTTKSEKQFRQRLARLERKGLFPLPQKDYTTKYKWFARISSTKFGQTMLLRMLKLPFISDKWL